MNSYLSREEKQNFVRATALVTLIEETIDCYAIVKSTDPGFLKYLRTGRTMIQKALKMRADALDPEAKEEFNKQAGRLEFICVPTPEAKKAHAELVALRTTLPMEIQAFEDWYSSVIETTCKTCCTEKYSECQIRRVLSKYGVYPIDPGAKGKCQYSYVGTPEAEELQPATGERVPGEVYNAALAVVKAKEDSINDNYLPLIKQLQAEVEQLRANDHAEELLQLHGEVDRYAELTKEMERKLVAADTCIEAMKTADKEQLAYLHKVEQERDEAQTQLRVALATQEQPKEEYSVSIGLASGGEFEYVLPARMTEIMIKEIQQPRHSRSTCAQYIAGRLVAVDLQEVVALHVDKLPQGDWVKKRDAVESVIPVKSEQERYRVECKCGAEYFCSMNVGRDRARCRECNFTVFTDRRAERMADPADGVDATLMTNRYWVERETDQERERPQDGPARRDVKEISRNCGRDYVDPCNPLG